MNSRSISQGRLRPTWPTRLGAVFLLLIFAIGFLAIIFSNNLYYLVVAMMLGFIAVSGLLAECMLYGLRARFGPVGDVFAGGLAVLPLELGNGKSRLPSFCLTLRHGDDGPFGRDRLRIAQLAPGEHRSINYTVSFPRRGWHTVEGVWIATAFPFRLSEKASFLPCAAQVLAFPTPLSTDETDSPGDDGTGDRTVPSRGSGSSVHSLRDYVLGDASRLIHWKRSAKDGRLTVKEMEQEAVSSTTVVLAPIPPKLMDTAAGVAAGILMSKDAAGISTTLITATSTIGPAQGPAHVRAMLSHLAVVDSPDAEWQLPAPTELAAGAIVLTASPAAPRWASGRSVHVVDIRRYESGDR